MLVRIYQAKHSCPWYNYYIYIYTTFTPHFKGRRRCISDIIALLSVLRNVLTRIGGSIYKLYPSYCLKSEVFIMLHCQLCSIGYTAFRIKNCSKSTSAIHAYTKRKKWCRVPSYINYHLKNEVSITLHCLLCSTRYTAVQIKNCSKSTSAIKIATRKKYGRFPL